MSGSDMPSMPLGISTRLSASLSSASLQNLERLHKDLASVDMPEDFLGEEDKAALREEIARRSRPRWGRNLHRLKATLLTHGNFASFDMRDRGPTTPTGSEASQSRGISTCQKDVFLQAFASAPDLGALANQDESLETSM